MSDTPSIRTVTQSSPAGESPGSMSMPGTPLSQGEVTQADIPISFSAYREMTGQPYTTERFNIKYYWDDPLFKDYRLKTQDIEDYVSRKISDLGLEDSIEAYEEVIQKVLDQIGSYESEKPESLFHRLSSACKALTRMESANIEAVISLDNLQTDEYEEII